ncbi:MAG: FAD-dependent monooxygenase [Pseudomonadota bacterium]
MDTQVIVAGSGPVGSIAAWWLAEQGIDVVVLEAGANCAADLRASTFHPPTLEMLEESGVTDMLLDRGLKAPVFHFRDRARDEVFALDLGEIEDKTKYPFRIQCEQFHMARKVADMLDAHPRADVLFSHRLSYFEQDEDGIDAYVETPVEVKKIRAEYIIGADGASSIVRKLLGIEFDGFTYPEKFLCLTTPEPLEDYFEDLAWVNYVSDPEQWQVILRVPSLWRVLVPVSEDDADEDLLSDATRDKVFKHLLKTSKEVETRHRTIYRVHQRVAKTFRDRRAFIIGDAAHLNNPLGGFGMNSGIHDARSLTERLGKVINNKVNEDLLDQFDRQRRTVTHSFTQAQTKSNMEMMRNGWGTERDAKRNEMLNLSQDKGARRAFLMRQSMYKSLEDAAAIA